MIVVREIRKSFGPVRAVRGVTFEVGPGEVVGLLGPNGAGKSTTLRIVTGFISPDSGSVTIDGADTRSDSLRARRRIGYLPESAPLYPEMSVRGYLDYRAKLFGLSRIDRSRAIAGAMDRCRIEDVARRRVGHLSKGYRQRVGLASALLHDPPVLVLDEPSNGLDPSQIRETRSLVQELAERRTMIVSSHILPEVERLCTRLVILAGGRVRADGSLAELAGASSRAYVVEIKGGVEAYDRAVGALPGVRRVDQTDLEGPWRRLRVEVAPDAPDPRAAIAEQASANGIGLRSLEEERRSLEQVFMETVERGEQEGSE